MWRTRHCHLQHLPAAVYRRRGPRRKSIGCRHGHCAVRCALFHAVQLAQNCPLGYWGPTCDKKNVCLFSTHGACDAHGECQPTDGTCGHTPDDIRRPLLRDDPARSLQLWYVPCGWLVGSDAVPAVLTRLQVSPSCRGFAPIERLQVRGSNLGRRPTGGVGACKECVGTSEAWRWRDNHIRTHRSRHGVEV